MTWWPDERVIKVPPHPPCTDCGVEFEESLWYADGQNDSICRECRKRRQVERQQRHRTNALEALGGKCACCGEVEQVFLSIDHIEGYEAVGGPRSGHSLVRHVLEDPDRKVFQVLCMNCNWAKYAGGCPHQAL